MPKSLSQAGYRFFSSKSDRRGLIAEPLADNIFVPTLNEGGSLVGLFEGIFETGGGAGIALLYVICSVCMFVVGLTVFYIPQLRDVERILLDHDEVKV